MLTLNQRINKIKDDIISQTSGLQNVLGNKVSTSGNQTIRDIKTFTSTIDGKHLMVMRVRSPMACIELATKRLME